MRDGCSFECAHHDHSAAWEQLLELGSHLQPVGLPADVLLFGLDLRLERHNETLCRRHEERRGLQELHPKLSSKELKPAPAGSDSRQAQRRAVLPELGVPLPTTCS